MQKAPGIGTAVLLALICMKSGYAGTPLTESQSGGGADQKGTSSSDEIPEVIVTAQRVSQREIDVPISVTALSGDQLISAGVTSTKDLSLVVPGLLFTTEGAWVQPNIRGVTSDGSGPNEDSPIAIYLDGLYLPSPQGGIFDLPDVERIEVLKGPQGTLFGRNATGGAIRIITLDPQFTVSGSTSIEYGEYTGNGESKSASDVVAKGFITGPLSSMLAGSLSVLSASAGGYYHDDISGGSYGAVDSQSVRGKLLWKASDISDFLLTAYYSHRKDYSAEAGFPFDGATAATFYPGTILPSADWHIAANDSPGAVVETYGFSVKSDFDIGNGMLTSLSGYTNTTASVLVDVDATYNSPACFVTFGCINYLVGPQNDQTYQEELTYASNRTGAISYVTGLFIYHDNGSQLADANSGSFITNADIVTRAYAAFGELTYDPTDYLSIIAGVRYSWEQKDFYGDNDATTYGPLRQRHSWSDPTPRVSVTYKVSSNSNVYATYSQGFKSGEFNHTEFTAPPANPEHLDAYEVGYKVAAARYSANFAAYYYRYKDLQVNYYNQLVSETTNAADATIYGLDVDGTAKLTDNLSLRLGGSYIPHAVYNKYLNAPVNGLPIGPFGYPQIAIDASGDRLLKTPKYTATATLEYFRDTSCGTFGGNATTFYSSEYNWDLIAHFVTRAYATVNADLFYQPSHTAWRATLFTRNLTNKAYIPSALPGTNTDLAILAPPREIGIKLDYKF